MSIFVCHHHLLYNLLDVLIGNFHCAIDLRSIWGRVMVLKLELHAVFRDHSIVKICTIVRDDPFGDAILRDKVMSKEPRNNILGNGGK